MGIGRFAYTPILPLMTAQAAVTPQVAGQLATANYVGYLAGALAGTASSRLTRSAIACRASLIVLVATLAAMPFASNTIDWLAMRTIAGFTSAVVFVIAVNSLLDHLRDHSRPPPRMGFRRRRHRYRAVRSACAGTAYRRVADRVVDGGGVRGGAERLRVDNGRNQKARNGFRGCSDARATA